MLFCALFLIPTMHSQVTIGTDETPVPGALLQLKNIENISEGNANSTKGLILPRVGLTSLTSLDDITKLSTESDLDYVGLFVYNVNEQMQCYDDPIQQGIYVWDGSSWQNLSNYSTIFRAGQLKDIRTGDTPQIYNTTKIQFVKDDGTLYDVEWMSENLRATVYSDNITPKEALSFVASNTNIDDMKSQYKYNNYDGSDFEVRGYYYNTFATFNGIDMTDIMVHDPNVFIPSRFQQGICPEGWRVPTYEDWVALRQALSKDKHCYYIQPKDKSKTYNALDGAFSANDDIFKTEMGYAGISRSLDEGGVNLFSDEIGQYGPGASFWMTFPSPWSTYLTPFSSPIYIYPVGTATVVQMARSDYMPVRCVKGDAPAQITYNPQWNYMLPNDVDRNVTNPNPPSGRNMLLQEGENLKISINP